MWVAETSFLLVHWPICQLVMWRLKMFQYVSPVFCVILWKKASWVISWRHSTTTVVAFPIICRLPFLPFLGGDYSPLPTRKPVLVLDSSKVNYVNVSFSLAPAKLYIDKYTLFISNEEGKLLRIHNVSKDYNTTLVCGSYWCWRQGHQLSSSM